MFGSRNPFATQDGKKTDFFGVVTFELDFKSVAGMEFTTSLLEKHSRMVFEASMLKKRDFKKVEEFFIFYDLIDETENHYQPILNRKHGKIHVRTAWNTLNHSDGFEQKFTKSYDYK